MGTPKRGLYIGRFQPFHTGHLEAIKYVLEKIDELVIAIGSIQDSHEIMNPFTAGERHYMIQSALLEEGIPHNRFYIVSIPDIDRNAVWLAHVRTLCPPFDMVYSNNPLVARLTKEYGETAQLSTIPFFNRKSYSATEVRRRLIEGENWEELVPHAVARIIKEINGVKRMRDVAASEGNLF
ncbi:MAG: nicotinamide-nucleotide adenylyltransferase [Promethearchaeota archaeon]